MKNFVFFCITLLIFSGVNAKDYYVATNGNNNNPGTLNQPFKTIGKAIAVMTSGDVCYLRKGIYRETISPTVGGVSFVAYNNEYVEISAFDIVKGWVKHNKKLWKVGGLDIPLLTDDQNLILFNKTLMNLAQWPNKTATNMYTYDGAAVTQSNDQVLTVSGVPKWNWGNGGFVYYYGSLGWHSWRAKIDKVDGGKVYYKFTGDGGNGGHTPTKNRVKNEKATLLNIIQALDAPKEFFYERGRKLMYIIPPDGFPNPNDALIEVRKRDQLVFADRKNDIRFEGLTFIGGRIHIQKCNNSIVRKCKFFLNEYGYGVNYAGTMGPKGTAAVRIVGHNSTIENNEAGYGVHNGLHVGGSNVVIKNNLFHDFGTLGTNSSCLGIFVGKSKITNNTMYNGGRHVMGDLGAENDISYNNIYRGALNGRDGGVIYTCCAKKRFKGTRVHHNWIHEANNSAAKTFYFDNDAGGNSVGNEVVIDHNVIWQGNFDAMNASSGPHIFLYNNTVFNGPDFGNKGTSFGDKNAPQRTNVRSYNNLYNEGDSWPGVDSKANLKKSVSAAVENFKGRNFFPKSNSGAVNKGVKIPGITDGFKGSAPDIGAYERGGTNWKAGGNIRTKCKGAPGQYIYYDGFCNKCITNPRDYNPCGGGTPPPSGGATEYQYDVGTTSSKVSGGYKRLSNTQKAGDFGWTNTDGVGSRDRGFLSGKRNDINRDINFSASTRSFRQNVSSGNWNVLITFGDTFARRNMNVAAEGQDKLSNINTNAGQYLSRSFNVNVNDGKLDLEFSVGNGGDVWSITRIWLRKKGTNGAKISEDTNSSIGEVQLYPNPATDILNVSLSNFTKGTLSLFSIIGKEVYQQAFDAEESSDMQINTSVFSRGIYLIRVHDENGFTNTQKVVLSE